MKKVAVSQDFEARRRQRLKMQHQKRARMRRIRNIIVLISVAVIAILLVSGIVRCAKKEPAGNTQPVVTQVPKETQSPENSTLDSTIPEPTKGNNDYLDVLKYSGQKKHVYLTFEDGPSKTVTPEILDVLRRYNVKATFFMTGKDIKKYPYLCTRAMEEGHLVLPLSLSGDADTLYADKTTFMGEIEETYKLICDNSPSTAKPAKIYRFPGGSSSAALYSVEAKDFKDMLAQNGYYYCDWNTTVGDTTAGKSAEQLLSYFNSNRSQLNNLVVRLQNTDNNEQTAKMLGKLIEGLLEERYTFNRLDEVDLTNADEDFFDVEKTDKDSDKDSDKDTDTTDNKETKAPTTQKPASTATPSTTKKPQSASTKAPTDAPKSTASATKKPQATVTEAPKTATVPPKTSDADEIESE